MHHRRFGRVAWRNSTCSNLAHDRLHAVQPRFGTTSACRTKTMTTSSAPTTRKSSASLFSTQSGRKRCIARGTRQESALARRLLTSAQALDLRLSTSRGLWARPARSTRSNAVADFSRRSPRLREMQVTTGSSPSRPTSWQPLCQSVTSTLRGADGSRALWPTLVTLCDRLLPPSDQADGSYCTNTTPIRPTACSHTALRLARSSRRCTRVGVHREANQTSRVPCRRSLSKRDLSWCRLGRSASLPARRSDYGVGPLALYGPTCHDLSNSAFATKRGANEYFERSIPRNSNPLRSS